MNEFIPQTVLAYLKRKKLKSTAGWTELWHGEHARYFTVAQSVYGDILNDVYEAVTTAIAEGETLASFKKKLTPVLEEKGWWGRTEDGVLLGSPRRLEIIYDTNVRMSYAAARWERIEENKHLFPYLQYIAVLDERTREQHRRWHNLILPVEHPFWKTHYPPNGWKCRCMVRQISAREAAANGGVSAEPVVNYKPWVNKKTGETLQVPEGIAPGFDYNAGVANLRVKSRYEVAEKLKFFNRPVASGVLNNILTGEDFKEFYKNPAGMYAIGVLDDLTQKTLQAQTDVCTLSDETLIKNKEHHPELAVEDYLQINGILGAYDILVQDSANSVVAVKQVKEKKYWLAVKVTRHKNEVFATTFHLTNERQIKKLLGKGKRLK